MSSTPNKHRTFPPMSFAPSSTASWSPRRIPSYDEARQVFFKGIDRRPLAVARVAGADDVARVVTAARETGLELAVRSGGHSRAGYGTSDGGLVIDLSGMNRSRSMTTGHRLGRDRRHGRQYTIATGERGRVTGPRDAGSVGIGGITLAGGIGFLARKNGLTIDDLLAAEVVTADGEVVQASEESEPELFWAIRGGESNFGVATRLQLRLHEISEIVGGMLILPATPETITGFLEAADAAPEELSTIANIMIAPPMPFLPEEAHGKPVVMALMAYVGPPDQAEGVLAPFRALAEPLADMLRPMRYPELYEGPEQEPQFGAGTNFFADSLDAEAAEGILEWLPKSTAPMRAVQIRVLGGAMARTRTTPRRSPTAIEAARERRGDVRGPGREGDPRRLGRGHFPAPWQERRGRVRRLPRRRRRGDHPRGLPGWNTGSGSAA